MALTSDFTGEDRQNANSRRRRDEDRSRGGPQHIKFEDKEEKGKMQLNGVDMVSVNAPAPAPVHSSLPAKPSHSVVPPAQAATPRLPGSGSGASEVVTTKRGISVIGGSAQSILDSRRANRMASINANLSAAEALKRELEGGSTEVTPAAETEAAVPAKDTKMEGVDEDAKGEPDEYAEVDASAAADPDTPRGKKRKAVEQTPVSGDAPVALVENDAEDDEEDDEDADGEDDDDAEDPPNPEADQPLPKKSKLQINPDGTVEYEDTVQ